MTLHRDTAGALTKLIEGGEQFDLALLTPGAIDKLTEQGKFVPGSRTNIARVGVGVVVKEGTPLPDISSVEAFKNALLKAKTVAYIDPHAGGSSGIYVAGLLEKLGIADVGQRQGEADPWRRGRDPYRQGCRRAWRAPDQRNPAREGDRAGRAAAEGDPELHHLCRRHRRQCQAGRSGEGADQGVCQSRTTPR